MNRLSVAGTPLPGLLTVERRKSEDARGFLSRLFDAGELAEAGWRTPVIQVNHTLTIGRGTVRGMHFQLPPHAEIKLVSCIAGEVWDVAVDLRAGSATFLHWHAERLSADNRRALMIPEGFAHGFQVMSEEAELVYCHSAAYVPDAEAGLHPLDPALGIRWPYPATGLSTRDAAHPPIATGFAGVCL